MSHRVWYRLTDVLPLLEHAMACFEHRLTGVESRITVPHGPALIWDSSPVMDLLFSNGVPDWHGTHGSRHAAEAYTWRDTSGAYGTAFTDDYHSAYLPLTDNAGHPGPVAHLLRSVRTSGQGWVTVDIDPADHHVIGPDRVHVMACRDDLVPAGTAFSPQAVTCRDVDDRPYPALVAQGHTSDSGDLLARFNQPTIDQMTADLDAIHANPDSHTDATPGEHPILRWQGDVLQVIEAHDNGQVVSQQVTDHLTPDPDGYYPLGAFLWHWQPAGRAATIGGASRGRSDV